MDLETVTLNEVSQRKTNIMISLTWNLKKNTLIYKTEIDL